MNESYNFQNYDKRINDIGKMPESEQITTFKEFCQELVLAVQKGILDTHSVGYIIFGFSALPALNSLPGLDHLFYLASILELPEDHQPKKSSETWQEFEKEIGSLRC